MEQTTVEHVADPIEGAKLFRMVSDQNFVLLDPVVPVEPYRIWRTLSSALPEKVHSSKLNSVILDWLSDRLTGRADACSCCKSSVAGSSECAMCSGALCAQCAVEVRPVVAQRDVSSRRNAATTSSLKLGIAMATHDSLRPIMCHLCSGQSCTPASDSKILVNQVASDAVEEGVADFRLIGALKRLNLPFDAEFLGRLLRKCSQDRVLALGIVSVESASRLNSLRGHVFPYPVDLCPRLTPSIMAAVPVEVFI